MSDVAAWRVLRAYTQHVDPILVDVVGPFFRDRPEQQGFWERHYVGGPHVRVQIPFSASRAAEILDLRLALEDWIEWHPSRPLTSYSKERVADTLRAEGMDPSTEDLEPHHDIVLERAPAPPPSVLSAPAQQLLQDFRRARGAIAVRIISDRQRRFENAFRLYLALALFVGRGSYADGSVSFKSHWENAIGSFPHEVVVKIQRAYARDREVLFTVLAQVLEQWQSGRCESHSLLGQWWRLLDDSKRQTARLLPEGEPLARPLTAIQLDAIRAKILATSRPERSSFLEEQWKDSSYIHASQYDLASLRPRILVNLLYDLVAAIGLTPLEKFVLCHHAFRTVEDGCACSLDDVLRRNVAAVLQRQNLSSRHRVGG